MPFIFSFISFLAVKYSMRYSLIIIYVVLTVAITALAITSFTFAFHTLLTVRELFVALLDSLNFGGIASSYTTVMNNFLHCIGFYQGLQIFSDLVLASVLTVFIGFAFKLIITFISNIKFDVANIGKML